MTKSIIDIERERHAALAANRALNNNRITLNLPLRKKITKNAALLSAVENGTQIVCHLPSLQSSQNWQTLAISLIKAIQIFRKNYTAQSRVSGGSGY